MIITHPDYDKNLKIWTLCDDVNTPDKVKQRGKAYLPFIGDLTNEDDLTAYKNYLERAVFYGYFAETVAGLSGMAINDGVTIENLAATDAYLETDADGDGVGLAQMMQSSLNDDLVFGRGGILVDYPPAEEGVTRAQQSALGLRAALTKYTALQIKNWHKTKVGGTTMLTMVSLQEYVEQLDKDSLTVKCVEQERRLVIDEDGYYQVELYADDVGTPIEVYQPRDSSGARLTFIPFFIYGSMNNDWTVDDAPLYSVADLNIAHYRNSADYEDSIFKLQPQPYATGLTQAWVDKNMKGFKIGCGRLLVLPVGGDYGIAQPVPNQLAFEGMTHKQEQMITLGAKLITGEASVKTASEAIINQSGQTSKLAQIIGNIEKAYNDALEVVGMMNGTTAPVVVFNVDLSKLMFDANTARLMLDSVLSGLIGPKDYRDYLRRHKQIERDEEEIEADIEQDAGLDLGGDDDRPNN